LRAIPTQVAFLRLLSCLWVACVDACVATSSSPSSRYCVIATAAQCEEAASALGRTDTTARVKSSVAKVAGCSTSWLGALLFNPLLTSTAVHNTGNSRVVICKLCSDEDEDRRQLRGPF